MRKQGAYIATFDDDSKGVYYCSDCDWESFVVSCNMSDEELNYKSIEWIEGQE